MTPDGELLRLPSTASTLAGHRQVSPFSRSGGLKNVVKPELIELAGNAAFDPTTNNWIQNDPGLRVLTLGHEYSSGRVIGFGSGTSLSAPKVAHLAARILSKYPEATPNLIRALLVQSARLPAEMNGWDPALAMQLCGFGLPNEDRALYCREQRVTYYCEDEIEPDQIHLFEIFVPSEIHDGKGKKSIAVTLAYDPPTSVVDANSPAGIELNWNLARGDVPIAQVEKAIVAEATKEERTAAVAARKALREKLKKGEDVKKDKSPFMLNTELPKKIQSQGTVQKNVFVWEKKGKFGATYHLAVSAKAIRPVHQKDKQRYAVVVTLECQDPETKLYALSRAKMLTARARVKVGSETPAISSGEGKA